MSSAAELPTGTVTFLFTDIEGSTQLLRELRDDYGTALADQQRIIREATAAHGGREIDTQGDAFFLAFPRAKDAVGAAVQAQRELAAHEWPQQKQLRVRMGIHTGEPAVGGERYVGMGVHRAARISAAGHGGQVLVSQTTRELLRDDPLPDVTLRDLGEHQLKDMDEPERIYQLVAPGLETDFPPLKAQAPSPIEGRESEVVEAARGTVREMASGWRRRRVVMGAGLGAAVLVAIVLAIALTRGNAQASGEIAANSVGLLDAKSGKVRKETSVGHAPAAAAVGAGAVWVTNADEDSVSKVDPETTAVRQTISVGNAPSGIAVGGGSVWVANGFDGTLSRIAPDTDRVAQTIDVGNGPTGVAYGGDAVWAANGVDGSISRVDPANGRVTKTIPAVSGISGIAFGAGHLWVAVSTTGSVLELDPKNGDVVARVGVGVDPAAVAVGADAVWVVNRSDGTLARIDPRIAAVTDAIQVGKNPVSVAADKNAVWVANAGSGTIAKIDPARVRVVKTVRVGNAPSSIAIARNGVYAAVRSTGLSHRGGKLRVASWLPYESLDPAVAYDITAWQMLTATNDGLVAFRKVGGVQGLQLVPDLATSLPAPGDGGKSWTFRLRQDIRYSNGRLVQPQDIRRALERLFEFKKPVSAGASYYNAIAGAAQCAPGRRCNLSRGIVTDPLARTITFRLTKPDPDFLTKLAMPWAYAVPSATPAVDQSAHPLPATGPYTFASNKNQTVRLIRNKHFREWSADAQPDGYPDQILLRTLDQRAAVDAVPKGRADISLRVTTRLSKAQVADLAARYSSRLRTSTNPQTMSFFLNTRIPPFNDVRARRAVNFAFDRTAYAQLLGIDAEPTCQLLPPNFPSFQRFCPYVPNGVAGLDKARRLVRASGTAGQSVRVWVPAPRAPSGRFMVSVLRSIGYAAHLKAFGPNVEYFPLVLDARSRAQVGFDGWTSDFPSESGFLTIQFACGGKPQMTNDPSFFCDHRIDRLMAHAADVEAVSPASAHVLWQRVERELLAAAPVVPTENTKNVDMVAKRVGNYQYHPQWNALLDQLWLR